MTLDHLPKAFRLPEGLGVFLLLEFFQGDTVTYLNGLFSELAV